MVGIAYDKILTVINDTRQNINALFMELIEAQNFLLYNILTFSFILADFIFAFYINYKLKVNEVIFLHYNIDFGADYIGTPKEIFKIPAIGLVIYLTNLVIAVFFLKNSKFLTNIILGNAFVVNLIIFISLLMIYRYNT